MCWDGKVSKCLLKNVLNSHFSVSGSCRVRGSHGGQAWFLSTSQMQLGELLNLLRESAVLQGNRQPPEEGTQLSKSPGSAPAAAALAMPALLSSRPASLSWCPARKLTLAGVRLCGYYELGCWSWSDLGSDFDFITQDG